MNQLIENADSAFLLDNEKFFNLVKTENPSLADLNSLISQHILGANDSLIYPNSQQMTMRKMCVALNFQPRTHFYQTFVSRDFDSLTKSENSSVGDFSEDSQQLLSVT